MDAIVGIFAGNALAVRRKCAKTGLKTRKCVPGRYWYVGCSRRNGSVRVMSPSINLINRVRSEFIEMPGLRLRIDQAQRLWNLDRAMCETVLRSLVEAKFLGRFYNEVYARL